MMKKLLVILVLMLPIPTFAGVTFYLDIEGIEGESQRAGHEDEIDVYGVNWGGFSDGRSTCIEDLQVDKFVDLSSPAILMAQAQGQVFNEVVLSFRKDSGDAHLDFLVIRLFNVVISSVSTSASTGDFAVMEKVSLSFDRALFKYTVQADDHSAGETATAEIVSSTRCR